MLEIAASEKISKIAALLLNDKALTWWRSVAMESWAKLAVFTWLILCISITTHRGETPTTIYLVN